MRWLWAVNCFVLSCAARFPVYNLVDTHLVIGRLILQKGAFKGDKGQVSSRSQMAGLP